jgi:flagellar hook protein FlgE
MNADDGTRLIIGRPMRIFVLKSLSVKYWGIFMTSISSMALSGMNAAQANLAASANNIANANTAAFRRQEVVQVVQANGGVSSALATASIVGSALGSDIVAQLQAKQSFLANLAVFKTGDQMAGVLLDKTA